MGFIILGLQLIITEPENWIEISFLGIFGEGIKNVV